MLHVDFGLSVYFVFAFQALKLIHKEGITSRPNLNPSPMITLDHLGVSSIFNFHISYIEDNAYFKFRGIGGFPFFFFKLPASIILFLVFSFSFFYIF